MHARSQGDDGKVNERRNWISVEKRKRRNGIEEEIDGFYGRIVMAIVKERRGKMKENNGKLWRIWDLEKQLIFCVFLQWKKIPCWKQKKCLICIMYFIFFYSIQRSILKNTQNIITKASRNISKYYG